MALQFRRGTDAERAGVTFEPGEPVFVTDTGTLYIGDGTTQGGTLLSASLSDDPNPSLASSLDLAGNNIIGTGNINITGNIDATGNINAKGSINLGDGAEDNVIVGGVIGSSLIPDSTGLYDLGDNLSFWRTGYFEDIAVNNAISVETITTNTILSDDSTLLFQSNPSAFFADSFNGKSGYFEDIEVNNAIFADSFTGNSGYFDDIEVNNAISVETILKADTVDDVLYTATTDTLSAANFVGDTFEGDLTGDIYASDSALILDSVGRTLAVDNVLSNSALSVGSTVSPHSIEFFPAGNLQITQAEDEGVSTGFVSIRKSKGTFDTPLAVIPGDEIGGITISGFNNTNDYGNAGGLLWVVDNNATLDNVNFTSSFAALFCSDNSSQDPNNALILENTGKATSNAFNANQYLQTASYSDNAERDNAITNPAAGMIVVNNNSGTPKFQGFDGTTWVNLN